jgi:uncharacterized protein
MAWYWVVLTGGLAGYISGLVGIGGGVVIVPALVYMASLSQQTAQGTTLAMLLLPIGALAVWNYMKAGHVDWRLALMLSAGYVVGSWFGSKLALSLSAADLKRVFALFLLVMAGKLLWDASQVPRL